VTAEKAHKNTGKQNTNDCQKKLIIKTLIVIPNCKHNKILDNS
jgi:hypothetical protein